MRAQRLRTIQRGPAVAALALLLPSCGASGSAGGSGASASVIDAGSDAPAAADDNGSPSSTYPAFAADMPQVRANQGTVLKAPILVTITWPSVDPNVSIWEAFGDGIGSSTFWNDTTSEYGIGLATSGAPNHVRMSDSLPPSMTYYEVQDYVVAALGGTLPDGGASEGGIGAVDGGGAGANGSLWPAPTSEDGNIQTIYSLFIPASTSVTDPGSGQSFCDEGGSGYHDSVVVGGRPVAYAVTLECPSQPVASSEETASHEYVEATTNPYPHRRASATSVSTRTTYRGICTPDTTTSSRTPARIGRTRTSSRPHPFRTGCSESGRMRAPWQATIRALQSSRGPTVG